MGCSLKMKLNHLTAKERREYLYYSRLLKDLNQHTPGTLRKKADEVVRKLKEKEQSYADKIRVSKNEKEF